MAENQLINENIITTENSSNHSDKKEKKTFKREESQNVHNNFYSVFIDAMSNEKLDTDKVKALITLEQNIHTIKEKYK